MSATAQSVPCQTDAIYHSPTTAQGSAIQSSATPSMSIPIGPMSAMSRSSQVQGFIDRLARDDLPRTRANWQLQQELQLRRCSTCRLVKPFSSFHRRQARRDRMYSCSSCETMRKRAYRKTCSLAAQAVMPALKLTKSGNVSGGMTYKRLREHLTGPAPAESAS